MLARLLQRGLFGSAHFFCPTPRVASRGATIRRAMDLAHLQRVGLSVLDGAPTRMSRPAAKGYGAAPVPAPPAPVAARPAKRGAASSAGPTRSAPGPCNLLGCCGFGPDLVTRGGRAPWLQPQGGHDVGLVVTNSLTNEKERFIPIEGKKIRWYTCGPTVYDVAHMGHARAYLTFDILRRVMQDYFGYELHYQINITDIDDKIIMRSRQNKLMNDFKEEVKKMDLKAFKSLTDEAVAAAEKKLKSKAPEEPAASAPEKDKAEYQKLVQEHKLKLDQHAELKRKVAAAAGSKDDLLVAAKDPIMAKLDKDRGHTVNEHEVFDAHARHFENEYFEDMDNLGVLRPDVVTRISAYMDGRVQDYIAKLVDLGFCYEANGSVYFAIDNFKKEGFHYRKLVPAATTSAAEMAEGEGALAGDESEKRNKNDFAVWKKSKPGEPAWPSPWGPGRPGWHIECSVMANDIHDEFLDIHGGGEDLKFPHHDNEMAQSEAYTGRPQWVNYFWHAGHLSIEGLKMSKSLKNFITIRQALETHSARQLRLMFLMQSWDKGMNYSDQAIDMAKVEERKMKHFLGSLEFHSRHAHGKQPEGERERALLASVDACEKAVGVALRDNFNTGKVIELVSKLISECYASYEALPAAHLGPVTKAAAFVQKILGILGVKDLVKKPPKVEEWTKALDAFASLRQAVRQLVRDKAPADKLVAALDAAAPAAAAAKKAGLADCASSFDAFIADVRELAKSGAAAGAVLGRCDAVRDKDFPALGVRLEDLGAAEAGFLWMFEDRDALAKELAEQAERTAAAARAKVVNKLNVKRQELKGAEKQSIEPAQLFRSGANENVYSAFDDAGMPTKLANGEELSAKKKKDLAKEFAKQQKDYEKLAKQAGGADKIDALLAKLRSEVEALEKQAGPGA
eukprot:TRINITY_DN31342_c0_g1_i1.p1 TRINITY_DN31342_c0_g1~~TRINITY_DN31342_c0_g1_i1.p1  ORF type:complete len:907 (+),score=271.46 TRINITY_DN31342_c0_g1_i1:12-2732(+)